MMRPRQAAMLAPAAAVFAVLFVAPFAFLFVVSFWRVKTFKLRPDFTFDNYADTFTKYLEPLVFTMAIGFAIATLTTALAFAFAYVIRFKAGRHGNALLVVTLVTLFGGYLVKIYAWKTILGTEGILNSALLALGLVREPLTIFIYNPGAVVVTLTHFLLPLAVLPIYGSLRGVRDITLEAARDLGARPARVFLDVVLPQCLPGVTAAFAFCFLIAAGDYVTPRYVGGPYTSMIGNFIEGQFSLKFDWPSGAAMAFTMLGACLACVAVSRALLGLARPR
ncbi:MAG: ABC transporter permease [Alphaproteobacteria bacterium]|nr:ABC transporter permease [Alphaproteobacteria bacterium]